MAGRNLNVILGGSLDRLADRLADSIRGDESAPLAPLVVSVPSRGIERWLAQALADRLGGVFDLRAPFPGDLAEDLQALVLGEPAGPRRGTDPSPFRPHRCWSRLNLQLHLFGWLAGEGADLLDAPADASVTTRDRRRWDFAGSLAHALVEAIEERPDVVLAWDRPARDVDVRSMANDEVPPALPRAWASLRAAYRDLPNAADLRVALAAVADDALPASLPAVVRVFAPSRLSPAQVDLLWKVGARSRVEVYLLSPSPLYFGDLTASRPGAAFSPARTLGEDEEARLPTHPLLARSARPVAELIDLLVDRDFVEETLDDPDPDPGVDPPPWGPALARIREDLAAASASSPGCIPPGDRSIVIANASGLLREVETLHDFLLESFSADESLRPRDVLVLAPDLEAYAPAIESVFRSVDAPELALPFTLADRRLRVSHGLLDALLGALALADSRFAFPDVLTWLERAPVATAHGLGDDDFANLRAWAEATGLRWGLDRGHRERLDLPAHDHFTWARSLATLVLGTAVDGRDDRLLGGLHPLALDGARAQSLSRLLGALAVPFRVAGWVDHSAPLETWIERLRGCLVELAGPTSDPRRDLAVLDDSLARLADLPASREGTELSFAVMRRLVEDETDTTAAGGSFLSGSITVAALQPLRAIPHRVIALLGMGERDYPRPSRTRPLSLLATGRRLGDPSPRHADRQLFLEVLIAARDRLFVSYQGRSPRDLEVTMPSIVVAELAEELARLAGNKPRDWIRLEPLHRHDPMLFDARRPRSHGQHRAATAAALQRARTGLGELPRPVTAGDVPGANEDDVELSVREFVCLVAHPLEGFLRTRMGVKLPWEDAVASGEEPMALDPLGMARGLGELLDADLAGGSAARERRLVALAARSLLPAGGFRPGVEASLRDEVTWFKARLVSLDLARPVSEAVFDGALGSFRVRGPIGGWVDGTRRVEARTGKAWRGAKLLEQAVLHLLAQRLAPGTTTWLLARDETWTFRPPADPEARLAELEVLAREAMAGWVVMPPVAALATWDKLAKDPVVAHEAAMKAFHGSAWGAAVPKQDEVLHGRLGIELPSDPEAWIAAVRHRLGPLLADAKREEA